MKRPRLFFFMIMIFGVLVLSCDKKESGSRRHEILEECQGQYIVEVHYTCAGFPEVCDNYPDTVYIDTLEIAKESEQARVHCYHSFNKLLELTAIPRRILFPTSSSIIRPVIARSLFTLRQIHFS